MKQQDSIEQHNAKECRVSRRVIKRILWIGIILDVLILDQLSKWAITEMVFRPQVDGQNGMGLVAWYLDTPPMLPGVHMEMTSFFNLVMAWNTGVSFSLFSGYGGNAAYVLIFVALAIVCLFSVWLWQTKRHVHGICYALIIGGALGNIVDRARFGAVIDFLDFHVMGYHWPAFNVADMAVVIGIVVLIIASLFFEIRKKERYLRRKQRKGATDT